MKSSRRILAILLIISVLFPIYSAGATAGEWQPRFQVLHPVRGVTAMISAPATPLSPLVGDGVSNWVSTIESRSGFGYWVQAGWEIIPIASYTEPYQYVELCAGYDYVHPSNGCSEYYHKFHSDTDSQPWGTNYEYWVYLKSGTTWCGAAGPTGAVYEHFCSDSIHTQGLPYITVASESHDDVNPNDSFFDQIRYSDAATGGWYLITQKPEVIRYNDGRYHFDFLIQYNRMWTYSSNPN